MSLSGKILALLNIFGAVGLVYLATLDYTKRQTLAHGYFRNELARNGLPVDESQLGAQNLPIVDRISDPVLQEMFNQVGGSPVLTQKKEVERVKGILDGKLQSAQNKSQQVHLLARILLPLTDFYQEREQVLSCRANFASDATTAALKKRCQDAFRDALAPPLPDHPEPPLRDSFRLAFRSRGGAPAEFFASLVAAGLPERKDQAPRVKIDERFDAAVESMRVTLEGRYNFVLAEALGAAPAAGSSNSPSSIQAQKGAIARLMFGLAPYLAEEAAQGEGAAKLPGRPESAAYQKALIDTDPFRQQVRRTFVVCGVRAGLEAITERASVLRRLAIYVDQAAALERQQFVFDHAAILEYLREYASVSRDEQQRIDANKMKRADYEEVARVRAKEVKDHEAELTKSRTDTMDEATKLQELSEDLLKLRIKVRDALRDMAKGEQRIRELEKQIRELEK